MRTNRIKALRMERGISQTELARALDVHQTAVSQWEKGRTNPDIHTLRGLSQYFGVSIGFLLGEEDFPDDGSSPSAMGIDLSDIEFAFLSETRDLTKEQKQTVLDFVRYVVKKKRVV